MTIAPHLAFKALPRGFREGDHPRDRLGKWIETGATVRLWGGTGGTVVGNLGGGRIEIERADGSHVSVHRNYLTVVKRPDGAEPSSLVSASPTAMPERAASGDVQAIEPPTATPAAKPDAGQADSLTTTLRRLNDPTATYLADAVQRLTRSYLSALDNDTPGDEASARGDLLAMLNATQVQYGEVRGVRDSITALRDAAAAEIPTTGAPDGPDGSTRGEALADVPAGGVRRDQGPGDVLPGEGGRGAGAD